MEKHIVTAHSALSAGLSIVIPYQLEQGDEECQIKRLVISGNFDEPCLIQLGLFQDTPDAGDFSADDGSATIYSVMNKGRFLLNETTTVRVPRNWHLAVKVHNYGVGTTNYQFCVQNNYKVLS